MNSDDDGDLLAEEGKDEPDDAPKDDKKIEKQFSDIAKDFPEQQDSDEDIFDRKNSKGKKSKQTKAVNFEEDDDPAVDAGVKKVGA